MATVCVVKILKKGWYKMLNTWA